MHTQEHDHDTTPFDAHRPHDPDAMHGAHRGHEAHRPHEMHGPPPASPGLTANDILRRIDLLIGETGYLRESVDALARIDSGGTGEAGSPGDIGAQAKSRAIASVIEQREQTNRDMIALLDRMYGDLSQSSVTRKQPRTPEEAKLIERLIDQSSEMSDDTLRAFLDALA